jgi:hypothetical protein
MKQRLFIPLLLIFFNTLFYPQQKENPKLVVGIVIDQMRFDYLYRFKDNYGKGGFNRLLNEGTNFTFAHINFAPTYTAPGHASIYTGTVPFYHGIVANNWFDDSYQRIIYCAEDSSVRGLGFDGYEGRMSPNRLITTTITDQLKLATNNSSKVITVSLKDRGAIMPGGHSANAAYWYESETGKFITSTYYMDRLPNWVERFNNRKLPEYYLSQEWNLSKPISNYSINLPDDPPYEFDYYNEGKTTFPHKFDKIKKEKKFELLRFTPFGNQILVDFVKEILSNEKLGMTNETDFLGVSFSSTDYIGHEFGPTSVEIMDTYIKLDEQLGVLLSMLDNLVGKGNYLLFLTADHGSAEISEFLKNNKIPSADVNPGIYLDSLKAFSKRKFLQDGIIRNFYNQQVLLNHSRIKTLGLDLSEVIKILTEYLYKTFNEIFIIHNREELKKLTPSRNSNNLILNGFNIKRSGDLFIELRANYQFNDGDDKTTHGTLYTYDTHIPLIFYGWEIQHQEINEPVYIVDIAPTIANLLHIQEPDVCIGKPILKINTR